MSLTHWMDDILRTQGYHLADDESRPLAVGLRFPTTVFLGLGLGAPPLPPNPPRRRHAFKIATAWLLDRYRRRQEPMPA